MRKKERKKNKMFNRSINIWSNSHFLWSFLFFPYIRWSIYYNIKIFDWLIRLNDQSKREKDFHCLKMRSNERKKKMIYAVDLSVCFFFSLAIHRWNIGKLLKNNNNNNNSEYNYLTKKKKNSARNMKYLSNQYLINLLRSKRKKNFFL